MTELEMASGGSMASPVRALGRWGILGALPRWLGEQVAAGERGASPPETLPWPVPLRRTRLVVKAPAEGVAPRATALALRRTIRAWRATERELATTVIDSRDRARLQQEFDALCAIHHRLFLEVSLPSRYKAVESAVA